MPSHACTSPTLPDLPFPTLSLQFFSARPYIHIIVYMGPGQGDSSTAYLCALPWTYMLPLPIYLHCVFFCHCLVVRPYFPIFSHAIVLLFLTFSHVPFYHLVCLTMHSLQDHILDTFQVGPLLPPLCIYSTGQPGSFLACPMPSFSVCPTLPLLLCSDLPSFPLTCPMPHSCPAFMPPTFPSPAPACLLPYCPPLALPPPPPKPSALPVPCACLPCMYSAVCIPFALQGPHARTPPSVDYPGLCLCLIAVWVSLPLLLTCLPITAYYPCPPHRPLPCPTPFGPLGLPCPCPPQGPCPHCPYLLALPPPCGNPLPQPCGQLVACLPHVEHLVTTPLPATADLTLLLEHPRPPPIYSHSQPTPACSTFVPMPAQVERPLAGHLPPTLLYMHFTFLCGVVLPMPVLPYLDAYPLPWTCLSTHPRLPPLPDHTYVCGPAAAHGTHPIPLYLLVGLVWLTPAMYLILDLYWFMRFIVSSCLPAGTTFYTTLLPDPQPSLPCATTVPSACLPTPAMPMSCPWDIITLPLFLPVANFVKKEVEEKHEKAVDMLHCTHVCCT